MVGQDDVDFDENLLDHYKHFDEIGCELSRLTMLVFVQQIYVWQTVPSLYNIFNPMSGSQWMKRSGSVHQNSSLWDWHASCMDRNSLQEVRSVISKPRICHTRCRFLLFAKAVCSYEAHKHANSVVARKRRYCCNINEIRWRHVSYGIFSNSVCIRNTSLL